MKLLFDGAEHDIPDHLRARASAHFVLMLEEMYKSIPDPLKVALMVVTRGMIAKMETDIRKSQGKEAAKAFRPPARSDPTLWLIARFVPEIVEGFKDAIIAIQTNESDGAIKNVALIDQTTNQPWGQMDIARCVGMRKNDGVEVP